LSDQRSDFLLLFGRQIFLLALVEEEKQVNVVLSLEV
jgi:hypothetical protein